MSTNYVLRPFQLEALKKINEPQVRHLICISPTGSGKSLIYQEQLIRSGARMLLITPLVALGRQQASRLRAAGVRTRFGNSSSETPGYRSWILSPESLLHEKVRRELRSWKPQFLAVDECHCLWDWGQDFRPAFQKIPELLEELPSIEKTLWLTATLPRPARLDLIQRLSQTGGVSELGRFSLPVDLSVSIRRVAYPSRAQVLLSELQRTREPGILFSGTRLNAERLSALASAAGVKASHYHAGLSREERVILEDQVCRRKVQLIVATSAFGMGMDFNHLSRVWLWRPPWSLLELAQAVGRVGRAGKAGSATLFWDPWDFKTLARSAQSSERRINQLLSVRDLLEQSGCRRKLLTLAFEESDGSQAEDCHAGVRPCDFCSFRLSGGHT